MIGNLIKKQMMEIFRSYFYDAKKNKKRSVVSTILFILLYIGIMVGVLGGMFAYLSIQLCKPFAMANMSWLYFLLMCLIAIALGSFGSVFNTYSGLYMAKDNDLLLSLPIPVRSILIARLASVYLLGLMYSAVVMIPAIIVYWIIADVTPMAVIGSILLTVLISLIVLILSCILGWCVAKISKKAKNKSFITVVASLLFFAAYYFVYFKAQEVIMKLLENVATYGENVKKQAYPVYLFGKIGEGYIPSMLLYTVVILALCVVTYQVLSRSFIGIATSGGTVSKVKYKEKRSKMQSRFVAVITKEFARFLSSPNYILNCGLGVLVLIIVGFIIIIKGNTILTMINQIFGAEKSMGVAAVIGSAAICLTASMNDMIVPSISLEGKNLWLIQSLPVRTWDVFKAKLSVQLLLTGIPVIFCDICMLTILKADAGVVVFSFIMPILFTIFMALLGLFLGINMPNLSWTNEIAPIKQSLSVMIALFGGWILAGGIILLYLIQGYKIGAFYYLVIVDVIMIALSVFFYWWLKTRGTAKFELL